MTFFRLSAVKKKGAANIGAQAKWQSSFLVYSDFPVTVGTSVTVGLRAVVSFAAVNCAPVWWQTGQLRVMEYEVSTLSHEAVAFLCRQTPGHHQKHCGLLCLHSLSQKTHHVCHLDARLAPKGEYRNQCVGEFRLKILSDIMSVHFFSQF